MFSKQRIKVIKYPIFNSSFAPRVHEIVRKESQLITSEKFFLLRRKKVFRRQKDLTFQTNLLRLTFRHKRPSPHPDTRDIFKGADQINTAKSISQSLFHFCTLYRNVYSPHPDIIVCRCVGVRCTVFTRAANRFKLICIHEICFRVF